MNKFYYLIVLILIIFCVSYGQININMNVDAQILTQAIKGPGIIINNLTYTNQSSNAKTIALFSEQYKSSNLPITSGIVMATGNVVNVAQPGSVFMSEALGLAGIQELTNMTGSTTYDGVFIDIDFVPLGDSIELTYIFASEEYPEYVCSYFNDAFAIFLTGPNPGGDSYNNTNIALIPNTNIPVMINSVNSGTPGTYGNLDNCVSLNYSQYYINNDGTNTHPVFDGLTTALVARAKVIPNLQYHIKISIADAGDGIYDSGLFIKTQSFKSNYSGNISCLTSIPLCLHPSDTLLLTTNTIAESGPNYACLCTQPNPSWYYLKVENSGNFLISINSPTNNDIDFICWGPFTDPYVPCVSQLTANCTGCAAGGCPGNTTDPLFYPSGNVVDCSYSPATSEMLNISNAVAGAYYIIMVTNYSNQQGKVVFNQINYGQTEAGLAFCDIPPACHIDSVKITSISTCDTLNKYNIQGQIFVSNSPSYGYLIIKESVSNTIKFINPPFQNVINFNMSIPITTNSTKNLIFDFSSGDCSFTFQYNPPLMPDVIINYSSSTCGQSNGTIIAVIQNNGLPPYSYHWSTGYQSNNTTSTASYINNVSAGFYSVSVYNSNNCYQESNIALSDNEGPALTTNVIQNQCANQCNGQIEVVATGNNFPYTYTWSTGEETVDNTGEGSFITSLCAGTYALTVTDVNNCSAVDFFQIDSLQELTYIIGSYNQPTCVNSANGSIEIIPSGGTPPYTINWSHNPSLHSFTLTNLSAGVYYFTITDAVNCSISDTLVINNFDNLNLEYQSFNPTCNNPANGYIILNVTGNIGNVNYYWLEYPNNNTSTLTNIPAGTYHVTVSDVLHCSAFAVITLENSNVMTANLVSITNPCQGEPTIAIYQVTGGYPPYYDGTHLFNNYDTLYLYDSLNIITFIDQVMCTFKDTIIAPYKPKPVVDISYGNPTCSANGVIVANVVSGIPPYSYYWSNGLIQENVNNSYSYNLNLIAGVYYLTVVHGNGCSSIYTVTLTNSQMELTVLPYSSCGNCNGSAVVTINSNVSQPPYTFQYSNNITHQNTNTSDVLSNLCPGVYSVTVTDGAGCMAFGNFNISDTLVSLSVNYEVTPPSCPGYSDGCVQITNVQGGLPPYSYNWGISCSNNETNYCCGFSSGAYQITIIDANQCAGTVTINMPDGMVPYADFEYIISNDTVYFINNSSQGNYLWLFGDGTTSTLANPSHFYSIPDTYTVCLMVFSCDTVSTCQTVDVSNIEFVSTNNLIIFPNPFSDFIKIYLDNIKFYEIEIYNILGEKIYSNISKQNCTTINTHAFKSGMYMLIIKLNDRIVVKKLIKN